jgi:hypothetical protein
MDCFVILQNQDAEWNSRSSHEADLPRRWLHGDEKMCAFKIIHTNFLIRDGKRAKTNQTLHTVVL